MSQGVSLVVILQVFVLIVCTVNLIMWVQDKPILILLSSYGCLTAVTMIIAVIVSNSRRS